MPIGKNNGKKALSLEDTIKKQKDKLRTLEEKKALEDLKSKANLGNIALAAAKTGWKGFNLEEFKAEVEKLIPPPATK